MWPYAGKLRCESGVGELGGENVLEGHFEHQRFGDEILSEPSWTT